MPPAEVIVPVKLDAGERVGAEARARVRRWDKAANGWRDLDVGSFALVTGGEGGARVAFSQPNSDRPVYRALLNASARVEDAPAKAGGKPGGLLLTAFAVAAGGHELVKVLITVKTAEAQAALGAALRAALPAAKKQ